MNAQQFEAFREELRINHSRWLNTKQTAEYLKLSTQRLEIWRGRGGGPPYTKINGTSVRYNRRKLDAWMREQS